MFPKYVSGATFSASTLLFGYRHSPLLFFLFQAAKVLLFYLKFVDVYKFCCIFFVTPYEYGLLFSTIYTNFIVLLFL